MNRFSNRIVWGGITLAGFIVCGAGNCASITTGGKPISAPIVKPGFEPIAPHGGDLVNAGDDFAHIEMVLDSSEGTLTAYILDGEAEEVVPLKQPVLMVRLMGFPKALRLKAVISPLSGEKAGATSSYSLADPALRGLTHIRGVLVWVNFNGHIFRNLPFQFPAPKE